MKYPDKHLILWEFNTANFRVICHVKPEDTDPADSFDDEEDIEAVRSGSVEWFASCVSVWYTDQGSQLMYLASDWLGCCAYKSCSEFLARDGYFPDMVREAIYYARQELKRLQAIKLRSN